MISALTINHSNSNNNYCSKKILKTLVESHCNSHVLEQTREAIRITVIVLNRMHLLVIEEPRKSLKKMAVQLKPAFKRKREHHRLFNALMGMRKTISLKI